jgi:rubrerythrin
LNAISLGESAAGVALEAWAKATPNEDLACVLRLVAARETSHGDVFRRRLCELGYSLREKADPRAAEQLARLADPNLGDLDKIPRRREDGADPFAEIRRRMAEGDFDPMTVNLMNWYIAEEKDSERRLREAYDAVREGGRRKAGARQPEEPSADAVAIMACMTAGFARLEKAMEKLAKVRRA